MIISAYKTSDGTIFEDERKATTHQIDVFGEALDTLMPDALGNVTRTDRHKILMAMMDDKDIAQKVARLHSILEHMARTDNEYDN